MEIGQNSADTGKSNSATKKRHDASNQHREDGIKKHRKKSRSDTKKPRDDSKTFRDESDKPRDDPTKPRDESKTSRGESKKPRDKPKKHRSTYEQRATDDIAQRILGALHARLSHDAVIAPCETGKSTDEPGKSTNDPVTSSNKTGDTPYKLDATPVKLDVTPAKIDATPYKPDVVPTNDVAPHKTGMVSIDTGVSPNKTGGLPNKADVLPNNNGASSITTGKTLIGNGWDTIELGQTPSEPVKTPHASDKERVVPDFIVPVGQSPGDLGTPSVGHDKVPVTSVSNRKHRKKTSGSGKESNKDVGGSTKPDDVSSKSDKVSAKLGEASNKTDQRTKKSSHPDKEPTKHGKDSKQPRKKTGKHDKDTGKHGKDAGEHGKDANKHGKDTSKRGKGPSEQVTSDDPKKTPAAKPNATVLDPIVRVKRELSEDAALNDEMFGEAALLDVSGIANDETPMAVSILSDFVAPQQPVKKKLGRKRGSNKDKYKPPHVKSIRPKRAGVYIPATERIHPFYSRNPFSDHAAHVSDEFEVMDLDIHTTLGTIIRAANSIKPDNTPEEAKARISTIKRHSSALAHKLSQWKDLMRRTVTADTVQTLGSLMHLRNLTAPIDRECFSH